MTAISQIVKIRLSPETREALKALGRKGESYDDVIRHLLRESQDLIDAKVRIEYLEQMLEEREVEG